MKTSEFERCLSAPDPFQALRDLAQRLKAADLTQAQVQAAFSAFLELLVASGRDEQDAGDPLRDVLDLLVGWCSPSQCLFPEEG